MSKDDSARHSPAAARARLQAVAPLSSAKCRLLVVDDHIIFRLGLRALLNQEHDFEVVADAGSTSEALQVVAETAVDVVITDLALPGRSGLELLAELHKRFPQVKTLVLTGLHKADCARSCLAAGATGYALKRSTHAEFLEAIRTVRTGERFICKSVSSRIVSSFLGNVDAPFKPAPMVFITRRERDILTRVASGEQNRQIADDLSLSVWAVRTCRRNLMKRFSLANVAEITAFAIGHGFIAAD